jgi:uncharacterized protein YpbB
MTELEITEAMLRTAAKKGLIGASRDDLFKSLRGIGYPELEQLIEELEQKGYITVQWLGSSDFVITVTPEGLERLT